MPVLRLCVKGNANNTWEFKFRKRRCGVGKRYIHNVTKTNNTNITKTNNKAMGGNIRKN